MKTFSTLSNLWLIVLLTSFSVSVSGQWVSRNSTPMTGTCYMVHSEQSVLYVGIENGLFLISEGGSTISSMNPGINVRLMARNNDVILVSDGAETIMRSTDGGANWSTGTVPPLVNVQGMCFNGSVLFLASYDKGVYKSEDNGVTWQLASGGMPVTGNIYLTINNIEALNNNIFITTARGMFKSSDNGASWVTCNTNLPLVTGSVDVVEISSMAIIDNEIFITPYNNGIFSSTDNGANWFKKPTGFKINQVFSSGSNLFSCTSSTGLFQSVDKGLHWTNLGLQSEQALEAGSSGTTLYALTASSNLLTSNDDGMNWNIPGENVSTSLNSVFINNNVLFTGGYLSNVGGVVQRSVTNGASWTVIPIRQGADPVQTINAISLFGTSLYAGAFGQPFYPGGLFRSDDNGMTWTPLTIGSGNVYSVNCFIVNNNKIFAGTNAGVYYSTNGTDWYYKGLDTHIINSLCFIGNTLYAGTDAGVFNSPDYGLTWGETGMGTSSLSIYSLCELNQEIYAGTTIGILHYHDSLSFKSWYPANGGIINGTVWSMVTYKNILFASTNDGHVYLTKNGGNTWGDITENLSSNVSQILIQGYEIYVATMTSGLWSRGLGDFTGIDNRVQQPLITISPNPASVMININLKGLTSGEFRVEVINCQGKIVISNQYQNSEKNRTIRLNFSDLAPGLYSVKVVTGNSSVIKKVVVQ